MARDMSESERLARTSRREVLRLAALAGVGALGGGALAPTGRAVAAPFLAQAPATPVKRLVVADTMTLSSADPARAYEIFQYLIFRRVTIPWSRSRRAASTGSRPCSPPDGPSLRTPPR